MRMYTEIFNQMRDLTQFVNARGIAKDDIAAVQQLADGTFMLVWYGE